MGETIVSFRYGDLEPPVLKVIESPDQVVIAIRSEPNEHMSLHREQDGTVVFTHWSPNKPPGTWDATKVEVAKSLGYGNPDKHAHYYQHRRLLTVQGMDSHHLVGRRINLDAVGVEAKYANAQRIVIDAPAKQFMLTCSLATPDQPYSTPDDPHVTTGFGDLYFRPESD